jgi:hypothetical protein
MGCELLLFFIDSHSGTYRCYDNCPFRQAQTRELNRPKPASRKAI